MVIYIDIFYGEYMKTKEEKSRNFNINKVSFWKGNWALLVVLFLSIIVILALAYVAIAPQINKKSLELDLANKKTTNLFSIDKIVCYSNAFGIDTNENQGSWNLDLSQYTDLAIYLNSQMEVSSVY